MSLNFEFKFVWWMFLWEFDKPNFKKIIAWHSLKKVPTIKIKKRNRYKETEVGI